ncbi:MAG: UvrD-helicase domain-containing protein, partial [Actinomycetes bacterium]
MTARPFDRGAGPDSHRARPRTAARPDQAARTRIVEAHAENLLVEAGAGTGKTKELVDRVVAMVSSGHLESVRNLAAITFTENAATELRTRTREALEDAVARSPAGGAGDGGGGAANVQRERCRRALEELDDAAITTLHGFAARLLTDAPVEAGLPPGFRVQDAVRTSTERDQWWRSRLDDWYADPSLAEVWRVGLTLDLTPTVLRDVLVAFDSNWDLLVDRPVPVRPLPALDPERWLVPLRALLDYAGGRGPENDTLTYRVDEVVAPLLREVAAETDPLQALAVFRDVRLRDCGNAAAWKAVGLDKATACGFLEEARGHRDAVLTDCRVAVTTALAERLRQAALEHAGQRRDRGEVWFHDLLVHAVRLLRDDAGVRAAVRARWQAVCVDEFQDTDP